MLVTRFAVIGEVEALGFVFRTRTETDDQLDDQRDDEGRHHRKDDGEERRFELGADETTFSDELGETVRNRVGFADQVRVDDKFI